ncbi:hypothetical protein [Noviherbaspirillum sp. UKPF54]|uniref:hypothetical protein n=1 Tax=Noviherbaspirillum sp. UKPF54 TaxID=2601898 RepID=UPI0011B109FE|nr:hypothetical protein [Noviherbaspirillum sp. UKPF54]QDZ27310.1 hypothetical protein FAY22_04690 [Noviherbaspirillum sp. UKPF54]
MKHAAPLIFFVLTASAHAQAPAPVLPASFETRVQLANDAETDERFRTYKAALIRRSGRQLARTMRSCHAVEPAPGQKSVVLVAGIGAAGRATAIAVKPDNAIGRCIASGFASVRFPKPPDYPAQAGFPVTMKISVAR